MKLKQILLTILFAAFLFVGSALCYLSPAKAYSESERRPLAQMPELQLASVANGKFMEDFEAYAADNFPFREVLRSLKALFSTEVFQKLDNNGLFVADGHISKLDEPENEAMMNHAAERFSYLYETYLKEKDTKIYLSIIPDKNFLLAKPNGFPSLDYVGFTERMKEKTPYMQYIDVTEYLSLEDYYTTDTHWRQEKITDIAKSLAKAMGTDVTSEYQVNTLDNPFYGVYSGQLAMPFPPDTIHYLTNQTLENCKVTYYDTGAPKAGELYNMKKAYGKDPYEMFLSGVAPLITIENPSATSQKELVLFRDSFGSSLAPLLVEGYQKITVVDIRYVQSSMLGQFVNFEHCDVLFLYSTTLLNNSLALK